MTRAFIMYLLVYTLSLRTLYVSFTTIGGIVAFKPTDLEQLQGKLRHSVELER